MSHVNSLKYAFVILAVGEAEVPSAPTQDEPVQDLSYLALPEDFGIAPQPQPQLPVVPAEIQIADGIIDFYNWLLLRLQYSPSAGSDKCADCTQRVWNLA